MNNLILIHCLLPVYCFQFFNGTLLFNCTSALFPFTVTLKHTGASPFFNNFAFLMKKSSEKKIFFHLDLTLRLNIVKILFSKRKKMAQNTVYQRENIYSEEMNDK